MSSAQPQQTPVLMKEEWIAQIGELWSLLLDLKVYPDWESIRADFTRTCGAKRRSLYRHTQRKASYG
jgi:hypothetical protein